VILAALARAGVASAEDLEQRLGGAIPAIGIMKRLVDLVDAGIVRVHDEDGRTRSGRRCRRYRLADEVRT
jgi:predicted ArsR family transcriptional regulator